MVGSRTLGPGPGRLAGLLLALYPTHVMFSTLSLTEPLFTILLLGAISCLLLQRQSGPIRAVLAGLLLGIAVLVRPLMVLLPLLLPLGLLEKGEDRRQALLVSLLVLVTTLAIVSPWLWRNHQLTGRWTSLTTSGGFNFWVGNNPDARGGYVPREDVEAALGVGDGFDWHGGYSMGLDAIRSDPVAAFQRLPLKVSHLVALETDGVLWNLKGCDPAPPLRVTLLLLFLANAAYLIVLGTASLALLTQPDLPAFGRLTVLLCAYMLIIVMVFFGDPRFHLPLVPFLLPFSASLFSDEAGWRWPGVGGLLPESRTRLVLWVGLMMVLGLLMMLNLVVKHLDGAW